MRDARRRRVWGSLVVVLLLLLAAWWWLARPESSLAAEPPPPPPSPPPAAQQPVAAVILPPAPRLPPVVVQARDASVAVRDPVVPFVKTSVHLKEGNISLPIPVSNGEIEVACRREALACAANELFWGSTELAVEVSFARSGGRSIVTGVEVQGFHEVVSPRFAACVERSIKAAQLGEVGPGETKRRCAVRPIESPVNDVEVLSARIGGCLGPVTGARSVSLTWDLAVVGSSVEVQNLEINAVGALDHLARRCIEQAANPKPVHFTEETRPPFERRRFALEVFTHNLGGTAAPFPPELSAPVPALPSLAPGDLTEAQRMAGEAYVEPVRAAVREHKLDEAIVLAGHCLEEAPRFAPCYRLLGSAAAAVSGRDASQAHSDLAVAAYQRFLELAPPGDEYVGQVRVILGLDAGQQ